MTGEPKGEVIVPGATIGILGGGQLGRMMALAGRAMGYRFTCLDPKNDSSCGQVCDDQVFAEFDDVQGARKLGEGADLITYEFENVDPRVTAMLQRESYLPQGTDLLKITRHRSREKEAVVAAGAEVVPHRDVVDRPSLKAAIEELGTPCVLKTATGGYDGKGQRVIDEPDAAGPAFDELGGGRELVVEKFVDFRCELSVIVARSTAGEVETFAPAENIHIDNRLHISIAPARVSEEISRRAQGIAVDLAESLEMVGVMGIEFFLDRGGEIYVNEMAPRPHNSGHFTMDACLTSQFEQHIRAVCGLPLGNPKRHTPVVMANLLGQHVEPWLDEVKNVPPENLEIKTHLYGKSPARRGRKMGHVNVLTDSVQEALEWIEDCSVWSDLQPRNWTARND